MPALWFSWEIASHPGAISHQNERPTGTCATRSPPENAENAENARPQQVRTLSTGVGERRRPEAPA